jgi:hypothetical protein
LSVSCRPGTSTHKLQVKTWSGACTHAPPRALQYRTRTLNQGGLQGCHVSSSSRSHLPDRKGSDAAMCTMTPDPLGGLRCTMCPVAPDLASLQGGLRATTCPAVLCGLQASSIKKSLAGLPLQPVSQVPSASCMFPRSLTSGRSWACNMCGLAAQLMPARCADRQLQHGYSVAIVQHRPC